MRSEDLENKIRGLAEQEAQTYQEKDWDKMEVLLNKHLPQEKKRRRFFFFLLFALLIAIPGYLVLQINSRPLLQNNMIPVALSQQVTVKDRSLAKPVVNPLWILRPKIPKAKPLCDTRLLTPGINTVTKLVLQQPEMFFQHQICNGKRRPRSQPALQ